LGQTDHALSYYFKALQYFDSTDKDCKRDCLTNIGWYHYLRGEYEEALDWFDTGYVSSHRRDTQIAAVEAVGNI